MYRFSTIRLCLLCMAALLIIGFALPQGFSQFSRPPIGGGIPPRATGGLPTRPGGIPGTPGQPPTTGRLGNGLPHHPPNGFGGGIPHITITHEWYCSGCRHVLGHGTAPPAMTSCPHCGARFVGVKYETGARPPNFGFPFGSGSSSPPKSGSELPDWDIIGFPLDLGSESGSSSTTGSGDSDSSSDDESSNPSTFRKSSSGLKTTLLVVGITIAVLFVLGVTGLLVWVTMNSSAKRPTRLNRQPRDYDVAINSKGRRQ
jgi:hypothetical protein